MFVLLTAFSKMRITVDISVSLDDPTLKCSKVKDIKITIVTHFM